jgi:hypothetical protein
MGTPPIEIVKPGREGAGCIRKLVAQRALHDAYAAVGGSRRGLGMVSSLESQIVE